MSIFVMYVLFLSCCRLAPPYEKAEWRWAWFLLDAATGGSAGELQVDGGDLDRAKQP